MCFLCGNSLKVCGVNEGLPGRSRRWRPSSGYERQESCPWAFTLGLSTPFPRLPLPVLGEPKWNGFPTHMASDCLQPRCRLSGAGGTSSLSLLPPRLPPQSSLLSPKHHIPSAGRGRRESRDLHARGQHGGSEWKLLSCGGSSSLPPGSGGRHSLRATGLGGDQRVPG